MHGYRSAPATRKAHPVAAALAALTLVATTPAALAIYSQVTAFESFQEGTGPEQVLQNVNVFLPSGAPVSYNVVAGAPVGTAAAYVEPGELRMGAAALATVFDARASLGQPFDFTPPPGGLPVVIGPVEPQSNRVSAGSAFQNSVRVVGTSPLTPVGAPARLRFTARLDGRIRQDHPDARENVGDARFEGGYRIFDQQAFQQAISNCFPGSEICFIDAENFATLVEFGARGFTLGQAVLAHSPSGAEGTNYRTEHDWSWELYSRGLLKDSGGDSHLFEINCFEDAPCAAVGGGPAIDSYVFDSGAVSLEFLTTVGTELTIDGSLGVFASVQGTPGSDAGWVQNQFLNTLGASLVSLTPGVQLQFAVAPTTGPTPGGSVPAPSTPWLLAWALLPAAGWRRRRRSRVSAGRG